MDGYRKIEPLPRIVKGNEPGPAPEVLFLQPGQLVVNEDYQRELSRASERQIRKMAAAWDWTAFKAPSVARTEDPEIFEVVDGQHTAIAAASNGNVPFLPCLVMEAATLADKARGFLGINRDRLALTKAAIYAASVAAQDDTAIAVEAAMSRASVRLLSIPPNNGRYEVGDVMAVSAMLQIAQRRGEDRLYAVLKILKDAQAAPIPSAAIKALDVCLPVDAAPDVLNRCMVVLRSQGVGRLEMIAKARTPHGKMAYETLADIIADAAKLSGKRLGRPSMKRSGVKAAAQAAA